MLILSVKAALRVFEQFDIQAPPVTLPADENKE
jgi:hypothetical protein